MPSTKYFALLIAILTLKAILIGLFIYTGMIGLGPDEAQYWTWSRQLDWGYYSKPPGIAWQIAAGTSLFGNTEFGVRFFSLIFSFLQALIVYHMALSSNLSQRIAFWCGLAMAFSPIGILGSIFSITDGGFLLFWSLACLNLLQTLSKPEKEANPMITGGIIALGALFKWPIYVFWIIYIAALILFIHRWTFVKLIFGIFISLFGLLSSLWWNIQHDWATFRHVGATLQGGSGNAQAMGNPLEFIGSQIALLSPFLFLLLVIAAVGFLKKYQETSTSVKMMSWTFLIGFSAFFVASWFQKIQGNWSLAIYPPSLILIGWFAESHFVWLRRATLFSMVLTPILIFSASMFLIPYKMNPFKHNMGLVAINQKLKDIGYDSNTHYLMSDKYQTTSQLSFYNSQQKIAYFLNLRGARNNQFNYWPGISSEPVGATGYFVWLENAPNCHQQCEKMQDFYNQELKQFFSEVTCCGFFPLVTASKDEVLKGALIFKCDGYNGLETVKSKNY